MSARLSKRGAARELGVALSSLQEAIASGRVTWPPASIDALRAEWLASTAAQGPAPLADRSPAVEPKGESLADARRRKETALADLRQLELMRERGDLCLADGVVAGLADAFRVARDRLLTIPVRLRELGLGLDATGLAEQVIREALEELSQGVAAVPDAARKAAQR